VPSSASGGSVGTDGSPVELVGGGTGVEIGGGNGSAIADFYRAEDSQ
jgi:hypothetical protein